MAINYIPNDPRAAGFSIMRGQTPRPSRSTARAHFDMPPSPPQARYARGTPQFLHWQAREAALAALEMFETVRGAPLMRWARAVPVKRLRLDPDAGEDLNAYYTGRAVQFFHYPIGDTVVQSGISTDVVAHEIGHALLDALWPELWSAEFLEAGAFHEAFGDCVAILTALNDRALRRELVASAKVNKTNVLETTAEDLSWAIKQLEPNHNASVPRRAHNKLRWTLPSSLPADGPPGALIAEIHSFGQVFSGCFYDLIGLLYANAPSKTEAQLWKAAETAGRLLFSAAENAPMTLRLFQSVGRAMAQQDQVMFAGAHYELIGQAFRMHNILLGSSAMIAPRSELAGKAAGRGAVKLNAAANEDARHRLGAAAGTRLGKRAVKLGGMAMAELSHRRAIDLSGIAGFLKGVRAHGPEAILVGALPSRVGVAAVMSAVPDASATEQEVRAFVAGLAARGQIKHNGAGNTMQRSAIAPPGVGARKTKPTVGYPVTHRIAHRGGVKTLERACFACGCRVHHGETS